MLTDDEDDGWEGDGCHVGTWEAVGEVCDVHVEVLRLLDWIEETMERVCDEFVVV